MSIANETVAFLLACLLGIGFGAFYDVLRILRLVFPHFKFIIFIEDLFFFTILSIASFEFILKQTSGVLRGFVIFGELLGAVFYFFTASILIMKLLKIVISALKSFFINIFAKKFCKNVK